jgi:hypothetical protein
MDLNKAGSGVGGSVDGSASTVAAKAAFEKGLMLTVPGVSANEYIWFVPLLSVHVAVSTKGGVSPLTFNENDPSIPDGVVLIRGGSA